MVVVEEKKTVFLVVQVTLVVVLNLDIVGVVESTGDENERLGLGVGVGVGHDSEDDAGVFQMREMNFVHHFLLLHYPLHNLNLEQSYGDEGLVGFVDKEDDYDNLFWGDPDSDPCSAYLLPAFNRTTLLLNQWFCFLFSHSSCNCHHFNFPISIITTKPKNALTVLSLTHSSICLSLSLYHFLPFLQVE